MAISKIILNGVTQMDLTQDTVAASNLISPNTAHGADGEPVVGTASGGGGGDYPWFGASAEKVATVINKTVNLSTDTTYDSWSASTTAGTIKAASSTPDYTLSDASGDYDYCLLTTIFCQPVYLAGTTLKSTAYRNALVSAYCVYGYADRASISAMQSGSPISNRDYVLSSTSAALYGYYYYNSSGSLAAYSTGYGPAYCTENPTCTSTVSNGKINISITLPAIKARCHSSRFATSMKTKVDSANTNIIIKTDLLRCPRGNSLGSAQFETLRSMLNAT